ncbi:hypothetical protein HZ326_1297 [Fusarium oxysporum f. sp. albedinis]|nr:hypothetical protein HZ326_1297 [Fusarium oxysporum f. sp. albedinis]
MLIVFLGPPIKASLDHRFQGLSLSGATPVSHHKSPTRTQTASNLRSAPDASVGDRTSQAASQLWRRLWRELLIPVKRGAAVLYATAAGRRGFCCSCFILMRLVLKQLILEMENPQILS